MILKSHANVNRAPAAAACPFIAATVTAGILRIRKIKVSNFSWVSKAKEYEWKAQSFVKVFSQLCSSLNISEEDTELNLIIRQMIAISLGLSPLNYRELFKKEYPDLTKWIRNCARNKSRNPLATFTLSLMHALTPKVHAPLSQQIAIRTRITQHCPMPTSEQKQVTPPKAQAPQAAVSSVTPSQPVILCPTPKRNSSTLQSARQVLKNFNF